MTQECVHIYTDYARELAEWLMIVEMEDQISYHRGYSCDNKVLYMWKNPQPK